MLCQVLLNRSLYLQALVYPAYIRYWLNMPGVYPRWTRVPFREVQVHDSSINDLNTIVMQITHKSKYMIKFQSWYYVLSKWRRIEYYNLSLPIPKSMYILKRKVCCFNTALQQFCPPFIVRCRILSWSVCWCFWPLQRLGWWSVERGVGMHLRTAVYPSVMEMSK